MKWNLNATMVKIRLLRIRIVSEAPSRYFKLFYFLKMIKIPLYFF